MGFVKTPAELASYFETPARLFPGAKMLGATFATRPDIVARLLPPPLAPAESPTAMVFIAEYPETNLGPGYREAALFLHCRYQGEAGTYCLAMPIDSEEVRCTNGRDIFGFPKKLAKIHLERREDNGARLGRALRRALLRAEGLADRDDARAAADGSELPLQGVAAHRPEAGLRRPGAAVQAKDGGRVEDPRGRHAGADLHGLVERSLGRGRSGEPDRRLLHRQRQHHAAGRGRHEVDADAYLPYYFKMVDFSRLR